MKKIICMLLAVLTCVALVACGQEAVENSNVKKSDVSEESSGAPAKTEKEEAKVNDEEVKVNYEEVVPKELQGVWGDASVDSILTLYAFMDNGIETYIVNPGVGAADGLAGTYTVEADEGKVKYDFTGSTGYSTFTYEDNTLALFNANGAELEKLTASDVASYLAQEENSANNKGVICLADVLAKYYADSEESITATEKKEAVIAKIKADGEASLLKLNTTYDKVQGLTWYEHKNQPIYADICNNMYPYIGRMDDGYTWLRVKLNYTDAMTDAGWIFFDNVIFSVDGENTTKYFSRNELTRDNDTEVWEIADFEPNASEIQLLKDIAASTETIIRFQGDEYYEDHIVTAKEKEAIVDVLSAYDYLMNYYE